jgi:acyl-CoA synthetase (AMP-forming)/AMP-acid ligase II
MAISAYNLTKNGKHITYKLPFKSFDLFLRDCAKELKFKPAVIFDDLIEDVTTISYNELNNLTLRLVQVLKEKYKLKTEDHVSFAFENTPEIILLNYAAWRAGFATVPLDTKRDTLERKVYKLKLTRAKLLFTRDDKATKEENKLIRKKLPKLKIVETRGFEEFKDCIILGLGDTGSRVRSNDKLDGTKESGIVNEKVNHSELSDCLILFTSGTTADPKGARLSLRSLLANAESIIEWLKITNNDRFYIHLPFHHINSTTFANATILARGTIVLIPKYSKSHFWEISAKNKVTISSIVPTIAYDLLSEEESFKKNRKHLKNFNRIQIGSAPVQPSVNKEFMEKYKIPLIQGYGQTETSLRSTGIHTDLSKSQSEKIRRLNSIGTELKFTNVEVLDENGKVVNEGEVGEICIRGPILMNGYLNSTDENRKAFEFEWFHSGDTGYWKKLFGRKYFFIVGRTKEIIKKAGSLISPLAIENSLLKNYKDLKQVYVIGFPDNRFGEEIGFIAVTDRNNLIDKIVYDGKSGNIKGLPVYESPKAGIIVSEESLPTTSTGKVQRIRLKELYSKQLAKKYKTIFSSETSLIRIIEVNESELLKKLLKINNQVWGKDLKSTLKQFRSSAANGILIGATNGDKALGSIMGLRLNKADMDKVGSGHHWTSTWRGITGEGTLSTNKHKGDSLCCVAISAENPMWRGSSTSEVEEINKRKLNLHELKKYLSSDKDYVIRFHKKPKGGYKSGAKIVKIIPNGRPDDNSSLGYNILMKYPELIKKPRIDNNASIGVQLIEAALLHAYNKGMKQAYVYTRPAELSKYFY